MTLHWAPGMTLAPAFGGERPPAKLESYTAITYKTFIKSNIILFSEGLTFFFFSLYFCSWVPFLLRKKRGKKKEKEKPPGSFI